MVTTTVVAVPPCRGSRSGSNASSRAQNACPRRWSAGTRRPSASSTSSTRRPRIVGPGRAGAIDVAAGCGEGFEVGLQPRRGGFGDPGADVDGPVAAHVQGEPGGGGGPAFGGEQGFALLVVVLLGADHLQDVLTQGPQRRGCEGRRPARPGAARPRPAAPGPPAHPRPGRRGLSRARTITSAWAIDTVPAATPAPTTCQRRSIPRASCSRPCSDRVVDRVRGASHAAPSGHPRRRRRPSPWPSPAAAALRPGPPAWSAGPARRPCPPCEVARVQVRDAVQQLLQPVDARHHRVAKGAGQLGHTQTR